MDPIERVYLENKNESSKKNSKQAFIWEKSLAIVCVDQYGLLVDDFHDYP